MLNNTETQDYTSTVPHKVLTLDDVPFFYEIGGVVDDDFFEELDPETDFTFEIDDSIAGSSKMFMHTIEEQLKYQKEMKEVENFRIMCKKIAERNS
ncbi:MAG: hypothetical protein LBE09_07915 [Christensenellaceae bacterium]|jgi:hypothetical protein|nr:hypothetical protein [Christensenellaceae bacterium]